jgi:hypothetical protein
VKAIAQLPGTVAENSRLAGAAMIATPMKQLAPVLFEPSLRPQTVPEADGLLRLSLSRESSDRDPPLEQIRDGRRCAPADCLPIWKVQLAFTTG